MRVVVFRSAGARHRRPVVKARRPERPDNARVRRALTQRLGPLWQNLAAGVRMSYADGQLAALIAQGAADADTLMRAWQRPAAAHLERAFRQAIQAGSQIGARHSGVSGELAVQGITARADRWIAQEGGRRISRINAETRATVQDVLSRSLRDRISPTRAAREIGNATGLTRAQARALDRYEAELVRRRIPIPRADTPLVRESIDQDVERYRDRLLRQRGATILETETQAAVQAGERLWWEEAGAQQVVALDETRKRWFTVQDERVCEICGPLHGVELPFSEPFVSGDFAGDPPAHPNCRCYLDYTTAAAEAE